MTDEPTDFTLVIAEGLWKAESFGATGRRRREEWSDLSEKMQNKWQFMACAAQIAHTEALKAAGMVVVPRVPTGDMQMAADKADAEINEPFVNTGFEHWKIMIKAHEAEQ